MRMVSVPLLDTAPDALDACRVIGSPSVSSARTHASRSPSSPRAVPSAAATVKRSKSPA